MPGNFLSISPAQTIKTSAKQVETKNRFHALQVDDQEDVASAEVLPGSGPSLPPRWLRGSQPGLSIAISYQASPRRSSTLMLASLMIHGHTVMVQAIPALANSFTTMVWKPNAFHSDIQVSATNTSG